MTELALETDRLTKRYGTARGIDDVTLEVPFGIMFGFIGPNGAGKSTTIRTVLGLLRPTAGAARLLGRDVTAAGWTARREVGYVPGEVAVYDDLRVGPHLDYLSRFHPGDHRTRRAELVEAFDLDLEARAVDLSLGNRKKLALVAALQHRPRLIILDEPTSGLDPLIQARLFDVLAGEVARGAAVFFSSHVLAEVQRTCQRVAVIREGRIIAVDDVAGLRGRALRRVAVTLPGPDAAPDLAGLDGLAGVENLTRDGAAVRFLFGGAMPALLTALAATAPIDVRIEEPSLDDVFLDHYRPSDSGAHEAAGG